MGMIFALLILLLFIAALYMSSKNWRITHVLLLFGVFAMTAFFVFLAAGTLKTHEGWKKKYLQLTSDIERVNNDIALLETGDISNPDSVNESIPHFKGLLAEQMVDRGRVWRGVSPVGATAKSIAIDMTGWGGTDCYGESVEEDEDLEPEPDPVAEEPADDEPVDDAEADPGADESNPDEDPGFSDGAPDGYNIASQPGQPPANDEADPEEDPAVDPAEDPATEPEEPAVVAAPAPRPVGPTNPHGIEVGTVVYAFFEVPSRSLPAPLQKAFFGESDLPQKDLRGACRVPGNYVGSFKVVSADGNSLEVSAVLPLDNAQMQIVNGGQGTWTLFEVMPADFRLVGDDLPAEVLVELFGNEEYGRDMQAAGANDADDQVEVMVKIVKETEVAVDADAIGEATGGRFDEQGRATLPFLVQGAPTTLKIDDEMWVRGDVAKKWEADGICTRTETPPRFVRPLRNYDLIFHEGQQRLTGVETETQVFVQDNKTITETADKAGAQIEFRKTEMEKINQDKEGLAAELTVLSQYQSELQRAFTEQRQALSRLYRWNNQSADGMRGPVRNVAR